MSKQQLLEGGFDPNIPWPQLVASYRNELAKTKALLEDEQRKASFLLKAIKEISRLNNDSNDNYEDINCTIFGTLFYVEVMTPTERQQADEDSAALVAAEDEAVFSRQGV